MTQEISIKYTKHLIDAINRLARAQENANKIEAIKWIYTRQFSFEEFDEHYIKLMAEVAGLELAKEEKGEADE